jgi:hypothetical protein
MKLIDERSQVAEVAARWKEQYYYGPSDGWGKTLLGDTKTIYEKLKQLPKDATARDVAAIIGNDSWAGPFNCNECGEKSERCVEVGQQEERTSYVCEPCLRKALALFEPRQGTRG